VSLTLSASGEELHEQFFNLRTRQDVAELLEIDDSRLVYHLFIVPPSQQYTEFDIPKKSGGVRKISAPATALQIIQRKLNQVLQHVYEPKAPVHGFVHGRSIATNAEVHKKQKYVFSVDLEKFFPSINFGRVRGMFIAVPYNLDPAVATVLAQICCFNNQLPQGAPTSPIVSNMICAKMDSQLRRLAQKHRCYYTRYADDLAFSTSMPRFPPSLAVIDSLGQVEVGRELYRIIAENGFEINSDKVRLQTRNRRQEVTGLTVNRFPNVKRRYVRQIRAMLHAWEKFELEAAQADFWDRYDKKHRNPQKEPPSFKQVVKGKIEFLGMVRGKDNPIYLRFREQLGKLAPELAMSSVDAVEATASATGPLIITEGKTDWKHLKAAFLRLKETGHLEDLDIEFNEYEDAMGDKELLKICRTYSRTPRARPNVCIFDRDNQSVLTKVSGEDGSYKAWGNNVFSFAIPLPAHRQDTPEISIEFYYKDSEIKRVDSHGRQLFLSSEFLENSGKHKENTELNCVIVNKIRASRTSIIDDQVFNRDDVNVALTKNDFADYVLNQEDNFNDFDFSEFERIFNIILRIVKS